MAEKQTQTISYAQLREVNGIGQRKMRQLLRERRMTERLFIENTSVRSALKELGEKGMVDSMIPLGGGFFVEGKVAPDTYKRTLPGNVVISATKADIEKELDERQKIVQKEMGILEKEIRETGVSLQNIHALMQMVRAKRAKKN